MGTGISANARLRGRAAAEQGPVRSGWAAVVRYRVCRWRSGFMWTRRLLLSFGCVGYAAVQLLLLVSRPPSRYRGRRDASITPNRVLSIRSLGDGLACILPSVVWAVGMVLCPDLILLYNTLA